MRYKLIKIDDYWIIVSDEKPNSGDWYLFHFDKIMELYNNSNEKSEYYFKLIASQNPEHNLPSITFSDEVAKKLGIVDIRSKLNPSLSHTVYGDYWVKGYIQAISDNKDKLFTLEQAEEIFREGYNLCLSKHFKLLEGKIHPDEVPFDSEPMDFNETIQSLTKQEYECELEMEMKYEDCLEGSEFILRPAYKEPKLSSGSVKVIKLIK